MSDIKSVSLIQFGLGRVGRALGRQILKGREVIAEHYGLRLNHLALVEIDGMVHEGEGLSDEALRLALVAREQGRSLETVGRAKMSDLEIVREFCSEGVIVIDVTAALGMEQVLLEALEQGSGLVLANKRPLTETLAVWRALNQGGRLRYESTVGAGLPVIATLRYLLDTGDVITGIEGCFSGTVGYICTQLEDGMPFSTAVAKAKRLGYTEPDPREDLGGVDVARKALILARTLGEELELEDIEVETLYATDMADLSVEAFMAALPGLDREYARRVAEASSRGNVLRYIASVKRGRCQVSLREVSRQSRIGSLRGPDNIVTIETERYAAQPLVIIGPGAGVEVAAAGVLGDMITLAREMH